MDTTKSLELNDEFTPITLRKATWNNEPPIIMFMLYFNEQSWQQTMEVAEALSKRDIMGRRKLGRHNGNESMLDYEYSP